jgi:DNA topoisomerase VI subunit A
MSKRKIFNIRGTDRREEYIQAFDNDLPFVAQVASGPNVEYFHRNYGFLLLTDRKLMSYTNTRAKRIWAVSKLSQGSTLALREFYYSLRSKPELVKMFETTKNIYEAVLQSIMHTEIVCDIDRHEFTVGNKPQGSIFYGHNPSYGDRTKLVGFTEDLARHYLNPYEITNAQSIIHLEKNTAAGRLQTMGFSKLTNSVLTTAGGNFTRAVYAMTKRFVNDKPMIFFTDGDPFGQDMLRTLEYGSMNSRHITMDQAFPENRHSNIHVVGLFPSVGERINLPNDVQSKRPMSSKPVRDRIDFLRNHELANEKDISTWERNKTYELEALSTHYESDAGDPIGLGAYLLEAMRLKGVPLKPAATDKDADEILEIFPRMVRGKIKNQVEASTPVWEMKQKIDELFNKLIEDITQEVYDEYEDRIKEVVELSDKDDIKDQLDSQYRKHPRIEKYDIYDVIWSMIDKVKVTVDWKPKEVIEAVADAIGEFDSDRVEYEHDVKLSEAAAINGELENMYDVVARELGIDSRHSETLREALEWRWDIE